MIQFLGFNSERNKNELNNSENILKDLYQELEIKDLVIKNLQSQLNSIRTNTNSVINSKVNNYNKEENNLRKQLIDKDKLLLEKEKEISELKNEIRNNQFNKLKLNQNYSDLQKEIIE